MRIERIKNFISEDECLTLNAWVELGVQNGWLNYGLDRGRMGYNKRLTSRFYGDRFEYPPIVYDVDQRIKKLFGFERNPIIDGHGKNGIVVSYTLNDGDVYEHRDNPRESDGMPTLRCNILTQSAKEGGKLHIEGQEIDIEVGELHCYLASEHSHSVSKVSGATPRILWMFGVHIPASSWEISQVFN